MNARFTHGRHTTSTRKRWALPTASGLLLAGAGMLMALPGSAAAQSAQVSVGGAVNQVLQTGSLPGAGALGGLVVNSCPECEPQYQAWLDAMDAHVAILKEESRVLKARVDKGEEIQAQKAKIAKLMALKGDYAESTDPNTGIRIRSVGIGGGKIQRTVYDRSGNQLSQKTYTRPSVVNARKKLARLEREAARLKKESEDLRDQRVKQKAAVAAAKKAFLACIKACALWVINANGNSPLGHYFGGRYANEVHDAIDIAIGRAFASGGLTAVETDLNDDGVADIIEVDDDGEVVIRVSEDGEVGPPRTLVPSLGGVSISISNGEDGDYPAVRVSDSLKQGSETFEILDGYGGDAIERVEDGVGVPLVEKHDAAPRVIDTPSVDGVTSAPRTGVLDSPIRFGGTENVELNRGLFAPASRAPLLYQPR